MPGSRKTVGGWLALPAAGRTAEFVHGSEHNDRTELEDGRHSHPPSTGTFTDSNCPLCKGR